VASGAAACRAEIHPIGGLFGPQLQQLLENRLSFGIPQLRELDDAQHRQGVDVGRGYAQGAAAVSLGRLEIRCVKEFGGGL